MKSWSDWQIICRQVAIGGRILDENDHAVAGAQVTITSMPNGFKHRLEGAAGAAGARWDNLKERPDRTQSRPDGVYFFLDLPEGSYTLNAIDPRTDRLAEKKVSVVRDSEQILEMMSADLKLSARQK